MAKRRAEDPNPAFKSMPEMAVDSVDYNLFYRPDKIGVSPALIQLSKSLESLVPSLSNYAITEEIIGKEKSEAKAEEDFKINKMSFAKMVKAGKIPEGANPHYFNKMMELDLVNKARIFKTEFDTFSQDSEIHKTLTPDSWTEVYESKLKEFYEKNELDKYDPLALSKAFFNTTSGFRDEREQQHNASRLAFIKKNTEDNAIKNYTGIFIEAQNDNESIEELFKTIQLETKSFIALGTDGRRANDLFLSGFKKYLDVIQDQDGFDYAREVLNKFKELKLSTGYFAGEKGGRRNETIRLELLQDLNQNELEFLEGKKKITQVKNDREKQVLGEIFFQEFNKEDFSLDTFLNSTTEDEDGLTQERFSNKDKFYIRGLNEALNKTTVITTSDIGALQELIILEENNPYLVKQKALELARDGKLNNSDFKNFFNSIGLTNIYKKNQFFLLSSPFQNYMTLFKDSDLASMPGFGMELPLMRTRFVEDMTAWHRENTGKEEYENQPYKNQKEFNAQVKLLMGDIMADSQFIHSTYDTFGIELQKKYNIFIEDRRPK